MINLKRTLNFLINKKNTFKIRLFGVSVGNVCPFDDGIAFIVYNKVSMQLTTCHIYGTMRTLHYRLDKILNQNFKLHPSINKDIGLLWSDELLDKPGLEYNMIEGRPYWVGLSHSLLSSSENDPQLTHTWLYLDWNDNIIFEVTPSYPWTFGRKPKTKKEKAEYITYEEFVKSYKPLVKIELSKEIAQQWLKQANEMITIIETNYQKMKDRGEV